MFDSRRHAQSIASFGTFCQIRPYTVKATPCGSRRHELRSLGCRRRTRSREARRDRKQAALQVLCCYGLGVLWLGRRGCGDPGVGVVIGWWCYSYATERVVTPGLMSLPASGCGCTWVTAAARGAGGHQQTCQLAGAGSEIQHAPARRHSQLLGQPGHSLGGIARATALVGARPASETLSHRLVHGIRSARRHAGEPLAQ